MKRLVLFLMIPLFLLACRSEDETGGELIPYISANYPITFSMPENWAVTDDADSITIASDESLLLASSVTDGARVNIVVTPSVFTGTANATEVLDTAVRTFRNQAGAEVIQEIENIVINTQPAVQTVLRGPDSQGNSIIFRYMVIQNLAEGQTAVVAAVHDADLNNQYGQLMADIVNSIQLGEPTPAQ
ncbi:MAG: hypothetical protein CL608_18955 [Anaerolineaceae bacterium]|nr:hypothetical protein [Anaerolineaceae bacterium]